MSSALAEAPVDRPFVYLNMASSVDGKITSAAREYPRMTSGLDRKEMDRLRAEADAILLGAGTLRADDPPLQVRDDDMQAYRRSLGRDRPLTMVVVTAGADLDMSSRFFRTASRDERIVATTARAPADRVRALEDHAQVWRIGDERVDLPALLLRLRRRGVERLLLEGGGELNWWFVRQDLVDELFVTIAPTLLGGREAPTLLEGEGLGMDDQRRLELRDVRREGDELYLRYAVVR